MASPHRIIFACAALAGISFCAWADGANFALAERFAPDRMPEMVHTLGVEPQWIGTSDRFWYRYADSHGTRFVAVDARRARKTPLFDHQPLRDALGAPLGELEDVNLDADGTRLGFRFGGRNWACEVPDCARSLVTVTPAQPAPGEQASASADGRYVAYLRDHDLYLRGPDGAERRLTHDGTRWHSFEIDPDTTYDNREGSPVVWIGATTRFFVQRWDRREVGELPMIDSLAMPRPVVKTIRSAMPGDAALPVHELWAGDAATGRMVRIQADKWPGQSIGHMDLGGGFGRSSATGVFPDADGRRLFFVRISRGYRERELCVADADTGEVTVLRAESDPRHVDIRFADLGLVDDGRELVWLTMRDGWKQLERLDRSGRHLSWITPGGFNVVQLLRVDSRRREVDFVAAGRHEGENPYHLHAFRASLDGGALVELTPGDATHPLDASYLSHSGRYLVDNASRPDLPTRSVLRDAAGREILGLERTDTSALAARGWKAPEPFVVTAADGETPLYGVMWKPFDFDPARRYPLVTIVYPGPGAYANTAVEFDPADPDWADAQALAQLGLIVIRAGNRGDSTYRHLPYALHGYGDPIGFALPDARGTVEKLAERHAFIDAGRVGIAGYSGGGFMTVNAMLTYPDFFKVGVAGSGNYDNNLYEQNSGEYHFGMGPYATPFPLAGRLAGKLLLLLTDLDLDANPAHTMRLLDAFVKADKEVDLMLVPGHGHGSLAALPYYYRRQWAYFAEHLLGSPRPSPDLRDPPAAGDAR